MERRSFIRNIGGTALLLMADGLIRPTRASLLNRNESLLRFAVTSDGHYGQANTHFSEYFSRISETINRFHSENKLNFCVVNGDIFHDKPEYLQPAADSLKKLELPYYVTKGNHDMVSDAVWESVWKMGVNHDVVMGNHVLLMGTTSNEKGTYLAPDQAWFESKLRQYKSAQNIFIFLHITPVKWTAHGVDAKEFQKLLKHSPNVRAVFNGHDHDQDGVKMLGGIPFLFDGHFGGSWGTAYRGFRVVELQKDNSLLTYMMDPVLKMAPLNIYNSI